MGQEQLPDPQQRARIALVRAPWWVLASGLLASLLTLALVAVYHRMGDTAGVVAVGQLQYDEIYYVRYGQAYFDRGNGFLYANPFDLDPQAPAVYTQLVTWVFGLLGEVLGIHPLKASWIVRVLAGPFLALGLYQLVACGFSGRRRIVAFWVTFTGGGVAWLIALFAYVLVPEPGNLVLRYVHAVRWAEGGASWWFLNLFRNYFFTTEVCYHVIFLWAVVFALHRAWTRCLVLLALALWTHAFTGIELGLVLGLFFVVQIVRKQQGASRALALAVGLMALEAIREVYLVRAIPSHAEVVRAYHHYQAVVPGMAYLASYGPYLLIGVAFGDCLYRVFREGLAGIGFRSRRCDVQPALPHKDSGQDQRELKAGFVVLAGGQALVAFALMNHHVLLGQEPAFQPAHFSRGYLFLPLALLALMALFRGLDEGRRLSAVEGRDSTGVRFRLIEALARRGWLVALLCIGLSLDTLIFVGCVGARPLHLLRNPEPRAATTGALYMSADEARVLEAVEHLPPTVIACSDAKYSYVLNVFTSHRTLLAHDYNTPGQKSKQRLFTAWLEKGDRTVFRRWPWIETVIVTPEEERNLLERGDLERQDRLLQVSSLALYRLPHRL